MESTSQKRSPCDYEFEILKINGSNFRVPIQNNKRTGKVIEQNQAAANFSQNSKAGDRP